MVDEIKPKIPKCLFANWKYCWQHSRSGPDYYKPQRQTYDIDGSMCAACLAAHVNWGNGATRRPLTKEEVKGKRVER